MGKKIITISIFLVLLVISVFAAYWYYNKYMKKPVTPEPAPEPIPTPDETGGPTTPSPDANIGKEAIAGIAMAVYDLNGNKVKDVNKGDDIGKVTGDKGTNFIIDEKYLVPMANTITR